MANKSLSLLGKKYRDADTFEKQFIIYNQTSRLTKIGKAVWHAMMNWNASFAQWKAVYNQAHPKDRIKPVALLKMFQFLGYVEDGIYLYSLTKPNTRLRNAVWGWLIERVWTTTYHNWVKVLNGGEVHGRICNLQRHHKLALVKKLLSIANSYETYRAVYNNTAKGSAMNREAYSGMEIEADGFEQAYYCYEHCYSVSHSIHNLWCALWAAKSYENYHKVYCQAVDLELTEMASKALHGMNKTLTTNEQWDYVLSLLPPFVS